MSCDGRKRKGYVWLGGPTIPARAGVAETRPPEGAAKLLGDPTFTENAIPLWTALLHVQCSGNAFSLRFSRGGENRTSQETTGPSELYREPGTCLGVGSIK